MGFFWIHSAKQHGVGNHHQALDVVVVSHAPRPPNGDVEWWKPGVAGVPSVREFPVMAKEIGFFLLLTIVPVNSADEFPPAHDLSNKPFE